MKVLLFNPPSPDEAKFVREGRCTQEEGFWGTLWPPLSLVTMAACLRNDGHEVQVVDAPAAGITAAGLRRLVDSFRPQAALWPVATTTICSDLSFAQEFKAHGIMTCVFGTHASALAEDVLGDTPGLDFVIRGEPELTALELLRALPASPRKVAGVSYRDTAGKILHNPDRQLPADLGYLPFPAWDLVNLDDYIIPFSGRRFVMMTPLRGCPFSCSFCTTHSYYGRRVRRFSVARVIAEMRYVHEHFAVRDIFFWSDTFTVDKAYVGALCQEILQQGLKITWYCNGRADTIDLALLKLMKKAGCRMISFGIESASQAILDLAGKHTELKVMQNAVAQAHEAGLFVAGHFIFGLPGETQKTVADTLRLAKTLKLHVAQFYCAAPFPGSALYDAAVRSGKDFSGSWETIRQDRAVIDLPELSAPEVTEFRRHAYRSFYYRPTAFLRAARLMAATDPIYLLKTGWKFIKHYAHN